MEDLFLRMIINDNDDSPQENCALSSSYSDRGRGAGWWFNDCSKSVLTKNHIFWSGSERTIITYVEMKVRPKQCDC